MQVSSAVCFLLSSGADYITGITITVDGGWLYYKPNWIVPGEFPGIRYVPNLIDKAVHCTVNPSIADTIGTNILPLIARCPKRGPA